MSHIEIDVKKLAINPTFSLNNFFPKKYIKTIIPKAEKTDRPRTPHSDGPKKYTKGSEA